MNGSVNRETPVAVLVFVVIALSGACGDDAGSDGVRTEPTMVVQPTVSPSEANGPELFYQAMEERPLALPQLGAGDPCPASAQAINWPTDFSGRGLVTGPLYPVLTPIVQVPRVPHNLKTLWVSDASYQGPALVRGHQLDGPNELEFFLVGEGTPAPELRIPLDSTASAPNRPQGWREWPSATVIPAAGCFGVQVDGDGFSAVIVFETVLCSQPC